MADAAEFVERFKAAWATADPDQLTELLVPDVRLYQPMCPPVIGRAAARQHFSELADLIRGLRGEVLSWAAHGDLVLIELRLSGLLGRRPIALTGVDRIVLQDDKIRERVIYFDAIPFAGTLLRRPRALAQLWKSETLRPRLARLLTSPLRGA